MLCHKLLSEFLNFIEDIFKSAKQCAFLFHHSNNNLCEMQCFRHAIYSVPAENHKREGEWDRETKQ